MLELVWIDLRVAIMPHNTFVILGKRLINKRFHFIKWTDTRTECLISVHHYWHICETRWWNSRPVRHKWKWLFSVVQLLCSQQKHELNFLLSTHFFMLPVCLTQVIEENQDTFLDISRKEVIYSWLTNLHLFA